MNMQNDKQYWLQRAAALHYKVQPYIAGKSISSASNGVFEKKNPATGQALYEFASGSAEDVDAAVRSAREAFTSGRWSHRTLDERRRVLSRLVDLIERDAEEIALLETMDVGKPISAAKAMDVPVSMTLLRLAIEGAEHVSGRTYPTGGSAFAFSTRVPKGVVGAIVGWNFPLVLAMQKIGPALIMGNTVVVKPSELSSLSVLKLAELALEAGLPEGVLNVVTGTGAEVGNAMAHHMDIDLLSFTGSTATGKRILQASGASNMKRLMLECGGKSANIVFDDIEDLDMVADGVIGRMFFNQGQVCTAGTRLIAHKSVHDELLRRIHDRVSKSVFGDPMDPATSMGPVISETQHDKIMGYIRDAVEGGCDLNTGGKSHAQERGGYYIEPTIFANVPSSHRLAQEEIFGPVLATMSFETVEEAISLANDTEYGLAATAWTKSTHVAQQIIRDLQVGEMVIRSTRDLDGGATIGAMPLEPHKQSGFGVENGIDGLITYTSQKSVQMFA